MATKLEGGKALVAGPLKMFFFAASLSLRWCYGRRNGTYNRHGNYEIGSYGAQWEIGGHQASLSFINLCSLKTCIYFNLIFSVIKYFLKIF